MYPTKATLGDALENAWQKITNRQSDRMLILPTEKSGDVVRYLSRILWAERHGKRIGLGVLNLGLSINSVAAVDTPGIGWK
jgi:hypothetical protein